jgi:hypothetical protein
MYWDIANTMKGIQVIIRDDKTAQKDCDGENEGWDEEKKRCYSLMIWNGKSQNQHSSRYFGGAEDLKGLFQKYGMIPLKTMRNAAECWEANGGSTTQAPKPWVGIGHNTDDIPKCLFAASVHKGKYESPEKAIRLDPNYIGSLNDRKASDSMLWPY